MRGLTLHQPWASFVASGAKLIETRGWATRWRGGLLIHAAKKWTRREQEAASQLNGSLYRRGCGITGGMIQLRDRLHRWVIPLGQVVATARLSDVVEMTERLIYEQIDQELEFGDWQVGRFAWILKDVVAIEPIEVKGAQRLWIPSAGLTIKMNEIKEQHKENEDGT